ncbi:MAG: hypothetical protein ACO36I_00960 [Candidatus Latescibacterota bacterium]|jgi:hypothetical protein
MAHLDIPNAETFFRTFGELLASGQEDKQISRKLSCPRSEAKRLRQTFLDFEIVAQETFHPEKLDEWLASAAGQRAQKQWEGQHRQQTIGAVGRGPKGSLAKQAPGKKQWNRQKV